MERLQGPINSCVLGEHADLGCLGLGGELPSLEDTMPFLEMLQTVETPPLLSFREQNFQTLLKLQALKKQPWETWDFSSYYNTLTQSIDQPHLQVSLLDQLESCVTHETNMLDLHSASPVKSEVKELELPNSRACSLRERKKRKRTRVIKNKEDVESHRMTHIAVERNRRRQMNDHLNSLRSLMPPSYVLRGDQASIIGGAIDFVKELEQLLLSLEEQKRMRTEAATTIMGCMSQEHESCEENANAETKRDLREIEVSQVSAIQNHVNLKIQCQRRPGQLLKAIVAMEDLRLTVLHLNITSSHTTVLYSFNLKIEEDCKVRSGEEVVAAVHHIFSKIMNGS